MILFYSEQASIHDRVSQEHRASYEQFPLNEILTVQLLNAIKTTKFKLRNKMETDWFNLLK